MGILELAQVAFFTKGRTKFTTWTSGAHDVIAITSPQKNDLCTEELREFAKPLDTVSLTHTGAAEQEQLGGERGEHAKHAPLGGSGGMVPQ